MTIVNGGLNILGRATSHLFHPKAHIPNILNHYKHDDDVTLYAEYKQLQKGSFGPFCTSRVLHLDTTFKHCAWTCYTFILDLSTMK